MPVVSKPELTNEEEIVDGVSIDFKWLMRKTGGRFQVAPELRTASPTEVDRFTSPGEGTCLLGACKPYGVHVPSGRTTDHDCQQIGL